MWLFTIHGFYSVVRKTGTAKGKLNVRARAREDLLALEQYLGPVSIIELDYTDYRYRIEVDQKQWAKVVAKMTAEIDYSNFKDEVKHRQGGMRASLYGRVWSALLDLQPFRPWSGRFASTPLFDQIEDPYSEVPGDNPAEDADEDKIEVICQSCGWYGERRMLKPFMQKGIDTGFKRCPECNEADDLEYLDEVMAGHTRDDVDIPF